MSKRIGIIGTRKRDGTADLGLVEKTLLSIYEQGDWLISGGCPQGGDRFAEVLAKKHGIPILLFHARWRDTFNGNAYNMRAGFVRNAWIAENSDVIIAVVSPEGRFAGGTGNTLDTFIRLNNGSQDNIYFV